ncbi:hypothetical protein ATW7_18170 [Alteromonadales bacterium TW-7]|nr:hypothetical protein ATW7_18170 [Alteromonadales bacterium TW-7]
MRGIEPRLTLYVYKITYELYSSRLQFTNKKAAVLNSGF